MGEISSPLPFITNANTKYDKPKRIKANMNFVIDDILKPFFC